MRPGADAPHGEVWCRGSVWSGLVDLGVETLPKETWLASV